MKVSCHLVLAVILLNSILSQSQDGQMDKKLDNLFILNVLHVNDIHVRIEETSKFSGVCKKHLPGREMEAVSCYGGVARLRTAVDRISAEQENVIFLNGGDFYQGNVWYTMFKWRVVAHFANLLNFTAMAIGNHEFDDHVSGFIPFLRNVSFPVIGANLEATGKGINEELSKLFTKSTVVTVGGRRIGIIGYTTTDTPYISQSDNVTFTDEVEAIAMEAKRLEEEENVDILLALGHSGYVKDQEIAMNVPNIDAVIGGHSHSFLYSEASSSESKPSVEKPRGKYPTIVRQKSGRLVPVVQAYAYTKYLGHLKLTFSKEGEVLLWDGSAPLLLDDSIPEDQNILDEMAPWKLQIREMDSKIIGRTAVFLSNARDGENNLGNFVTDAMIAWYASAKGQISAAIMNSGGLRGSLEVGDITMSDLLTTLPFSNTFDLVTLEGRHLREILEYSISKINSTRDGGILQVSGLELKVHKIKKGDSIILKLKEVKIWSENVKMFTPLKNSETYNISLNNYMYDGGDGYRMIKENAKLHIAGPTDIDVIQWYLRKHSPVETTIEGRMKIISKYISPYFRSVSAPRASVNLIFVIPVVSMINLIMSK